MARADFNTLAKLWTHSALTWKQKIRVYVSLVQSKLLYSMASLTLTVAQPRKLNGFQNRCLRKIVGVPPSYISRVSNAAVLAKSQHPIATDLLLKKRLQRFGKVLRVWVSTPTEKCILHSRHFDTCHRPVCAESWPPSQGMGERGHPGVCLTFWQHRIRQRSCTRQANLERSTFTEVRILTQVDCRSPHVHIIIF